MVVHVLHHNKVKEVQSDAKFLRPQDFTTKTAKLAGIEK